MSESLVSINVEKLSVGMYIAEDGNDWIPEANKKRAGFIYHAELLEQIRSKTDWVTIDVAKGCPPSEGASTPKDLSPRVSLQSEQAKAQQAHAQAKLLIGESLLKVQQGKAVDVAQVDDLSDQLLGSLERNQNALLCLSQIRSKDTYLLEHSCNVGMLLGVLARSMGFADDSVRELITAGMLHDVGKIRVEDAILHKPGKLEPQEWQEMQNHVVYGVQALERSGGVSDVIMGVCALHHERLDGKGYPMAKSAEQINIYGRMATVADVYDAITADRCYHKGMAPAVAMKRMAEWAGDHFDRQVLNQFVRAMGVYPVGSTVELDSGRVALVTEENPSDLAKPRVKVIYSLRSKHYLPPEDLDLSKPSVACRIVRPMLAQELGISLKDFV